MSRGYFEKYSIKNFFVFLNEIFKLALCMFNEISIFALFFASKQKKIYKKYRFFHL